MQAFWEIWYEQVKIQEGNAVEARALAMRDLRSRAFLVTLVLGFIKVYDESLPEDHPDNYYMEREWRKLGNLKFTLEHVTSILVPDEMLDRARTDLPRYANRLRGIPKTKYHIRSIRDLRHLPA